MECILVLMIQNMKVSLYVPTVSYFYQIIGVPKTFLKSGEDSKYTGKDRRRWQSRNTPPHFAPKKPGMAPHVGIASLVFSPL